jgi:hypothetical protein
MSHPLSRPLAFHLKEAHAAALYDSLVPEQHLHRIKFLAPVPPKNLRMSVSNHEAESH